MTDRLMLITIEHLLRKPQKHHNKSSLSQEQPTMLSLCECGFALEAYEAL